ncbi:hypothetical protein Trydic_g2464 [Trypoxylus dichotomus]
MSVGFPLSVGRVIESGSDRRFLRAEMRHLAVSKRIWSAMALDRAPIEDAASLLGNTFGGYSHAICCTMLLKLGVCLAWCLVFSINTIECQQVQKRSCNDFFHYGKDNKTGKTVGVLTITQDGADTVELKANLSVPILLNSSVKVGARLLTSKSNFLAGKPLSYMIYFPPNIPLPTLIGVEMNSNYVCNDEILMSGVPHTIIMTKSVIKLEQMPKTDSPQVTSTGKESHGTPSSPGNGVFPPTPSPTLVPPPALSLTPPPPTYTPPPYTFPSYSPPPPIFTFPPAPLPPIPPLSFPPNAPYPHSPHVGFGQFAPVPTIPHPPPLYFPIPFPYGFPAFLLMPGFPYPPFMPDFAKCNAPYQAPFAPANYSRVFPSSGHDGHSAPSNSMASNFPQNSYPNQIPNLPYPLMGYGNFNPAYPPPSHYPQQPLFNGKPPHSGPTAPQLSLRRSKLPQSKLDEEYQNPFRNIATPSPYLNGNDPEPDDEMLPVALSAL